MKKILFATIAIVLLVSLTVSADAAKSKTFDLTITSFPISYKLYADILGEECDISREWISNNQAIIHLNDVCFCTVETESRSDLSYITNMLFTACPQSQEEYSLALRSMFLTIYTVDSYLGIDLASNLVTTILPQNGKYTSERFTYQYTKSANVYMIAISPR